MNKTILLICLALAIVLAAFFCGLTAYADRVSLAEEGCIVLLYHKLTAPSELSDKDDPWAVCSTDFYRQLRYLKEQGVQFITVEDLERFVAGKDKRQGKYALITFDDGHESVYEYAFPFLQKEKIPFALFLITGQVGNPNYKGLAISSWDEIKKMASSNLATVGIHTHNLHFLEQNGSAPFLNPDNIDVFAVDLNLSMAALEKELGYKPAYFAYPYGFGIPETDELLMDAGIRLIFTTRAGIVQPGDPPFFIKRVNVNSKTWPAIARWARQD